MSNVKRLPDSYAKSKWIKYSGAQLYNEAAYPLKIGAIDHASGEMSNIKAQGVSVTLRDVPRAPLAGLRVFGKTEQNGTPTPDNPIPLVSVGDEGNIIVSVNEQILTALTPNGLPAIPVTDASVATYTDENGQMWCADEVDFERGVYVKRIYHKVFDGTESFGRSASAPVGNYFTYADNSIRYNVDNHLLTGSLCNKLSENGSLFLWNNDLDGFAIDYTGSQFRLRFTSLTDITSVDTLKAKLAEWYANGEPMELITLLATPIETPLSEEELTAYRALHSNYPVTTVLNDSGAHMKVECVDNYKHTDDYLPAHDLIGKHITLSSTPNKEEAGIAFYDSEKVYISGSHNTPVLVPINAAYMRFTVSPTEEHVMLNEGAEPLNYEPYTGREVVYDYCNNYKLLNINEQAVEDVKSDLWAIFDARDIENATGRTLDLIGEMVGQKRGAMTDEQYRYVIRTKVGMNTAQGTYESAMETLTRIFNCTPKDIVILDGEESGWLVVQKFPLEVLVNAGFTSLQAVDFIKRVAPVGVKVSAENFQGTFEFAATADVYDETAGFADIEQTMGGYFGLLLGGDENSPVLPF